MICEKYFSDNEEISASESERIQQGNKKGLPVKGSPLISSHRNDCIHYFFMRRRIKNAPSPIPRNANVVGSGTAIKLLAVIAPSALKS